MSNPYFDLQNAIAAHLHLHPGLADMPIITEELGDVINRLEQKLAKGGYKESEEGKSGAAMIIHTPTGLGQGGTRTLSKEQIKVRVEIYIKPLINSGANGLQKQSLQVIWDVKCQMQTWNTGPGQQPIEYLNFDTLEQTKQEASHYIDFAVPKNLSLSVA